MRRLMYLENESKGLEGEGRVAYWTSIRALGARVEQTWYRAGASTRTAKAIRRNERRGPRAAR